MNDIYIIGAGGHGQVVADALFKLGISPKGFLDDGIPVGKEILGIHVVGSVLFAKRLNGRFIIAIGDNETRKKIVNLLNLPNEKYFSVIHPSAVIGKDVNIGPGSMIMAGAVINVGSNIGNHVIINTSSSIDHHNSIGDFVHIAPGSHTGGNVFIDEGAFLGLGSSVIPGIKIEKWAVVGAGAVVVDDVPSYSVSVGIPARVIRRLK